MANRVFGPQRGAGVQIKEVAGFRPIVPGALGVTAYAGLFEKGNPGELVRVSSPSDFLKRMGNHIDDGLAPDACIDFFDLAQGAGSLHLVRVTDGNELQAEMTLFNRKSTPLPMGTLKAINGGNWGGRDRKFSGDFGGAVNLAETTLDTQLGTFTTDEWKGGYVQLNDVGGKRYAIVGNDNLGVITVSADATMSADHIAAGAADDVYYLVRENEAKELAVEVLDGEENPLTEFKLVIYVDGVAVRTYPDLSTDPASTRYWVDAINNDDGNDEVFAVDLFVGAHVADVRPANHYNTISAVTATLLTADISRFEITFSPGGGDPTFVLGATVDEMVEQTLTITMASALAGAVVSSVFGALGTHTLGTLFDPVAGVGGATINKFVPPFTVTAGGTALALNDIITIRYQPMVVDDLIGGMVWPDKPNAQNTKFRITDNDHSTITVADGSDMTVVGAALDEFLVSYVEPFAGGRDGNADIVDGDFISQAWDLSLSPFTQLFGKNLGLVKMATPGVTAVNVVKAGVAYAEAKNYQYRIEVPAATVTEDGAESYVNSIGRSDYMVGSFPAFGSQVDPLGGAGLKETTLTGQIHGREAAIARDFEGYHKAEAGVGATLSKLLEVPTGDKILDEEFLNPLGLSTIKKIQGNFVIWGDRTLFVNSEWKFKHQREQMSHYEHILQENFDFIVFAINDPITEKSALTSLRGFFLNEFRKRALRGATLEEAAIIKIDGENNTDATRADGDMFADILLRLADTVERFRIRIGKQGIFESVV